MSYPQPLGVPGAPAARMGGALAAGAAVAVAGAAAVGVFTGLTTFQSAKAAILLGWLVGLVVRRAGANVQAAASAAIISLAASAAASLIGAIIYIVRVGHIPLSIVVGHISRVISLLPQFIGWLGFVFWLLSALAGWATVQTTGHRRSPRLQTAPVPDVTPAGEESSPGSA